MIVGICMVRDAADIIGPVVLHMLAQVDHVIVADNLSGDETRPILDGLADEHRHLTILDDLDPAHRQGAKTTGLAEVARREFYADWVVPFDSDEIWYSPFGRIAAELEALPSSVFTSTAVLFDHIATGHDDPGEADPTRRIRWRRRTPGPFPKVACRTAADLTIAEGNHSAYYGDPRFPPPATIEGRLIVRHFPYRSVEQMAAKARTGAAALDAGELPASVGKHWRDYAALGPALLADVFREHYYSADPDRRNDLIFDPAPVS